MSKSTIEVYLVSGQTFRIKCDEFELTWDTEGKVTKYTIKGMRTNRMFAVPPQKVAGIRRVK